MVARHKCERPRQKVRYTKVVKLCCLEIVSYIRSKGQRLNHMTHWEYQVIGGEVISEFPKFRGQWTLKATTSIPRSGYVIVQISLVRATL